MSISGQPTNNGAFVRTQLYTALTPLPTTAAAFATFASGA